VHDSFEEMDMSGDRLVLVPVRDPLPRYNRGRTRIEPHLPTRCSEVILELEWS
jgi:hypothetical protein